MSYLLREVGALATWATLRHLARENAGRGFDPWAGEQLLPTWLTDRDPEPTTSDLYPTMLLPLVRTP